MIDVTQLGANLFSMYKTAGLLSRVVILRLNTTASAPSHTMYKERQVQSKIYTRHEFDVLLDEGLPKRPDLNPISAVGARSLSRTIAYFYGADSLFPRLSDEIEIFEIRHEITSLQNFHMAGMGASAGVSVTCRRFDT